MNAFKKFGDNDTYITSYTANKQWSISQEDFHSNNIKIYKNFNENTTLFNSIKHLFYSQMNLEGEEQRYENYYQSTLNTYKDREYNPENTYIISIPVNYIGTNIKPGSIRLVLSNTQNNTFRYFGQNYIEDGYFLGDPGTTTSTNLPDTIIDDKKGILRSTSMEQPVGIVVYTHGLLIIDQTMMADLLKQHQGYDLKWQSTTPIYTKSYLCKLNQNEFNYTLNKTGYHNETGDIKQNLQNKEFTPYITTVGLYNNKNDLIAVAKTSQPIPKSKQSNMTVDIKMDIPFKL